MELEESVSLKAELGENLVEMMAALRHRGSDSTGFAMYGPWREDRLVARLRVEGLVRLNRVLEELKKTLQSVGGELIGPPRWDSEDSAHDAFVRLETNPEVEVG